jgi:Acetyltransferase (GNAT) domain
LNLTVLPFNDALRPRWNAFARQSKNGTFLLARDYMEYHSDRFDDCSLLILHNDEILALLPANRSGDDIHSHQGLTYGGLVTSDAMTTPLILEVFAAVTEHLRAAGARRLFYKTIPYIYHRLPAEEDRYALFLAGAQLYRRDVLSVVPKGRPIHAQLRRRRGAAKAARLGVKIARSDDWAGYWALLSANLDARHGLTPVHDIREIDRLRGLFPDNIRLHVAVLGDEIAAGVVIYESAMVAHAQYIASSEHGRECGALDKLFLELLDQTYADKPFFDFGTSNEQEGRVLNRGLIDQKEGFGARAVVHDFYRIDL